MTKYINQKLLRQFPEAPGCYIIRDGLRVLYVGQSHDMRRRWKTHHRREFIERNFPNATVETVECTEVELLQLEARLINELKPIMNNTEDHRVMLELGLYSPEQLQEQAEARKLLADFIDSDLERPKAPSRYLLAMNELPSRREFVRSFLRADHD